MRTSARTTITLVLIWALMLGAAGSALAGGNGGSKGTLKLIVLSDPPLTDSSTSAVPHYGDEITFEVSTTATDQPFVNVRCYQGDAFVYDGWAGFFEGARFGQTFTLSSTYWVGGEAGCNARLVMWGSNGRERTLATTSFYVEA
jgi:hypothetical protein